MAAAEVFGGRALPGTLLLHEGATEKYAWRTSSARRPLLYVVAPADGGAGAAGGSLLAFLYSTILSSQEVAV